MNCIALVRAHTQPHGVSTPYWTENRHSEKVSNTETGSAAEVKGEQGVTADHHGADQCSTPTATPCNTQDERAVTGADEGDWDEV